MSFTYDLTNSPRIAYVRLLIGDTVDEGHIFDDEEITAAYTIQGSQFQSSMFFSGTNSGRNLPSQPVSYLRVAALLLDSLASAKSRIGAITKLLDVSLDPGKVAKSLREQANQLREVDDNAGAMMIIEQCTTGFSYIQRFNYQIQRQNF